MGIKDYAKKKILTTVGEVAAIDAITKTIKHIDKQNEANSLSEKTKKHNSSANYASSEQETISTKSFFEEPSTYRLTMIEKIVSLRRSYTINDSNGNIIYTAKSVGLPKIPELGLYNKYGNKIGKAEKGILGNPMFTLHYNGRQIASLHQKYSFKPKYEIPENGWKVEGGLTKATVYDNNGAIAIQIQYMLSAQKGTIIVEYTNKENEIPAILITLAMVIAYHM